MLNELGLYLAGTVMRGVGLWLAVTVVEWMWGRKLIGQKLSGLWWLLLIVTMVPFHQRTVRVRMEQPVTTTAVPAEASTAVEAAERAYPRTQFRQFPRPEVPAAAALVAVAVGAALLLRRILLLRSWERRIRRCAEIVEPRLIELLAQAAAAVGLRKLPGLRDGGEDGPFCFGLRQPYILLPAGMLARLEDREVSMLLVHELNHLARHDQFWTLLLYFIEALCWFNPFVRLCRKRLAAVRELDCDREVVRRLRLAPRERAAYAGLILNFSIRSGPVSALPETALGREGAEIKQRMREVAMKNRSLFSRRTVLLVAVLGGLAVGGFLTPGCSAVRTETQSVVTESGRKLTLVTAFPDRNPALRLELLVNRHSPGTGKEDRVMIAAKLREGERILAAPKLIVAQGEPGSVRLAGDCEPRELFLKHLSSSYFGTVESAAAGVEILVRAKLAGENCAELVLFCIKRSEAGEPRDGVIYDELICGEWKLNVRLGEPRTVDFSR